MALTVQMPFLLRLLRRPLLLVLLLLLFPLLLLFLLPPVILERTVKAVLPGSNKE